MELTPTKIEILLKDLLSITKIRSDKLPEVMTNNFNFFYKEIIELLRREYHKPKNNWRILCGCFLVIGNASKKHLRINDQNVRKVYPLLAKGFEDSRISIRRQATICVLNILGQIHLERTISMNDRPMKEINEEITELKKSIKSNVFLESFNSLFKNELSKRVYCEEAGIKKENLREISLSILG